MPHIWDSLGVCAREAHGASPQTPAGTGAPAPLLCFRAERESEKWGQGVATPCGGLEAAPPSTFRSLWINVHVLRGLSRPSPGGFAAQLQCGGKTRDGERTPD